MIKGKRATPKQVSILISQMKLKVQTPFDSFSAKTNTHFSLCLNYLKRDNIPLLYCIQTFRIPAKYLFWIVPISNSSFYQQNNIYGDQAANFARQTPFAFKRKHDSSEDQDFSYKLNFSLIGCKIQVNKGKFLIAGKECLL